MNTCYNDKLIVKSNNLIEAFIEMSKNEYKLILYLISKINKSDTEFRKQQVTVREFAELIDIKKEHLYTYLMGIQDSISRKTISIFDIANKRIIKIPWFGYIDYKEGEGILEVAFNYDLTPHLIDINIPYTKYLLSNIKDLTGMYSIRLYEFLKQYEKLKKRTMDISKLKVMLGIKADKYKKYSHFKERVLLPAKAEINLKTDILIDFKEIKLGRKINTIEFHITPNKQEIPTVLDQVEHLSNDSINIDSIYHHAKSVISSKIPQDLIKKLLSDYGEEKINFYLQNWVKFSTQNMNNKIGFFVDCVRKGYDFPEHQMGKPIQSMNYEQRQYDDDHYDSLYANLNPEIDD